MHVTCFGLWHFSQHNDSIFSLLLFSINYIVLNYNDFPKLLCVDSFTLFAQSYPTCAASFLILSYL